MLATAAFLPVTEWTAEWSDHDARTLELVRLNGERWRIDDLTPEWCELVAADGGFGMIAGSDLWLVHRSVEHIDKAIAAGGTVGGTILLR